MGVAIAFTQTEARAGDCAPATPACHLAKGKELLESNPKRAAEELLASYMLDERTDTLEIYADALARDKRYALALDTWKRVIVFRDSEVTTAEERIRTASGKKLTAAKADRARAQKQSEQAAEAIIKLWPNVGRVKVKLAPGQDYVVTHDGVEVDATKDVLVNAGRDVLVFTRKDGNAERVKVEVAAGSTLRIDAPDVRIAAKIAPKQPRTTTASIEVAPKREPRPEPIVKAPATEPAPEPATAVRYEYVPRSRTLSRVGLGLVGGSLIAGGIAGTFAILANRDFNNAKDLGCSSGGECPFGEAADLAERSNDRARLAQISAVGAGALLVGGAALWFYGHKKTRRATAPELTLNVAPSNSSAAIAWRF
ncbi:MAG: hypothetical protein ABI867_19770 [Kofleriaceae bacterium]